MDKTILPTPLQPPLRVVATPRISLLEVQPTQPRSKTRVFAIGLIAIIVIGILSTALYINDQQSRVLTLPAQESKTSVVATPTAVITDTAPNLPINQKAQVIIHHSDSSFETLLVPVQSVGMYTKNLPLGDTVFKTTLPK